MSGEKNGTSNVNWQIASQFDEIADLLEDRCENDFRVRAYRRGADLLRELLSPVTAILEDEGPFGLSQLPGIGRSLTHSIEAFVRNGQVPMLAQLRGADSPERRFSSVPGVGPKLAERIHEQLHVETLGELEAAAMDGRLQDVPGMGPGRTQAVRDSIRGRTPTGPRHYRVAGALAEAAPCRTGEPSVGELLSVDAEYRRKAGRGDLICIAPKRFNPTGVAWLPILRTRRQKRHYSLAYSNTARAHELGMNHDWVVIRRSDRGHAGQWTVVTSRLGSLQGRRIVRGREAECLAFYDAHPTRVEPDERFASCDQPRQKLLFNQQA